MLATKRRLPSIWIVALIALTGCDPWKPYVLRNPATGREAACFASRGWQLPPEQVQRLRQCIAACEARGYLLVSPGDVPPPVPPVEGTKPPSIPLECVS